MKNIVLQRWKGWLAYLRYHGGFKKHTQYAKVYSMMVVLCYVHNNICVMQCMRNVCAYCLHEISTTYK